MITAREISYGLFGAWRLAHLDPDGMRYLDTTVAGFWRSFWAAAVVAPGYAMLVLLRLAERPITAGPTRIVLVEVIAYAIGWTAFPLASWYLVSALGRAERYCGYIVAFNWANVLQVGAFLPVIAISGAGILPEAIMQVVGLAVMFALLFYQYFIARTALQVEPLPAIALVMMDIFIGVLLEAVATSMEMG